jgi:Leucine-rich repeat (LRR) protein
MRGRGGARGGREGFAPAFTLGDSVVATKSVQTMLQSACKSGVLRLAHRDLVELPAETFRLADLDYGDKKWWLEDEMHTVDVSHNKLSILPADFVSFSETLRTLNASYNQIANVFADFGLLRLLVKLDLSHNRLQGDLDSALGGCTGGVASLRELKECDLSHNQLTSASGFAWLPNLSALNLSNNRLTRFECGPQPSQYAAEPPFRVLQQLVLANNALDSLPPLMSSCRHLALLDASANRITTVPRAALPPSLQTLNLRQNQLCTLSIVAPALRDLIIGSNKFTTLPDLAGTPQVCFLDASSNQLTSIDTAADLKQLVRLDVQNNELATLPPRLSLIRSLNSIVLDGNPLRGVRRDIISKGTVEVLKYLKTRLSVTENDDILRSTDAVLEDVHQQRRQAQGISPTASPVAPDPSNSAFGYRTTPPAEPLSSNRRVAGASGIGAPRAATGIIVLGERNGHHWDLSYRTVGSGSMPLLPEVLDTGLIEAAAPATFNSVQGCTSFSVKGQRRLQQIDPAVMALVGASLKEVDISETAVSDLGFLLTMPLRLLGAPAPPYLHTLTASSCRLAGEFALEWCTARSLVRLDLSRNQLSQLSTPLFANMSSLAFLNLSNNRFQQFPRVLFGLPSLTELHLASNGLHEMPDGAHKYWAHLQVLDLSYNELQTVPFTLGLMHQSLRTLKLEGNRMRWLRQSVLDRGTPTVLEFLREKIATP